MNGQQLANANDGRSVVIETWTDLTCPWCYIGKDRLQQAIDQRPDADRFEIRLRSFELDPGAPHEPEPIQDAFIRFHGGDADSMLAAETGIQRIALREGLAFSLNRLSANTFDIHRVLHHASEQGVGPAYFSLVQDRLFAGDFNPFDPAVLADAAQEVGLSADRVLAVLAGQEYADAVRADRREGMELGVTGVPFVVFDRQVAASGAQSVAAYGRILEQIAPLAALKGVS